MKLRGKYLDDIFVTDEAVGDGVDVAYVLTQPIQSVNSISVFLNGILRSEYSVNLGNNTVTFDTAPALAQEVTVKYVKK